MSMKRFDCSGSLGGDLGLLGMALSGRTRECFDDGRGEGVRCRSRQPLRMLLGPSLKYKQILPNCDIAWTCLDWGRRKAVEPTYLESAIKVAGEIRGAPYLI